MVQYDTLGELLVTCSPACKITVNDIYKNDPIYEGRAGDVPCDYYDRRLIHCNYRPQDIVADTASKAYRYVFIKGAERGDIEISLIAENTTIARDILAGIVKDANGYVWDDVVDVIEV